MLHKPLLNTLGLNLNQCQFVMSKTGIQAVQLVTAKALHRSDLNYR